jgi:hypothetical protein
VAESVVGEFTVSDLICGWDGARLLLTTTDPDQLWDVVSAWPPRRLATVLVSAVTVMLPDDAGAGSRPPSPGLVVTGHVSGGCGSCRVFGHVAATEWPR